MTFAMFVPAIALLILIPCLLVSQQVGVAVRTLWSIWATQLLQNANYPPHEIWQKGDTQNYLNLSAWFLGVVAWIGSFWVMVTLAGLLLRTDVMSIIPQMFPFGADSSAAWQIVVLLMLVTSLMTHDYMMSPVRQKALSESRGS